jgi:hypothetical protein
MGALAGGCSPGAALRGGCTSDHYSAGAGSMAAISEASLAA